MRPRGLGVLYWIQVCQRALFLSGIILGCSDKVTQKLETEVAVSDLFVFGQTQKSVNGLNNILVDPKGATSWKDLGR
jgi:hypothetical protein